MASFYKNVLLSFILLFWSQSFKRVLLTSAGEATTATSKEVHFSGWRPMMKPEALNTTQFVEKFADKNVSNSSGVDIDTSETRRSFLLVYPPRPQQNTPEETQHKQNDAQPNNARNIVPPVRASPTQSRYHRMMNFGASEGSNRRVPTVFQRQSFPPVANPPPLPPHARKQKKLIPNFKPESTSQHQVQIPSQHQVQIQLLDGYIVPPSGGGGLSTIHAKDKGSQITTFPLSLNNVPEIRLLLPGDVHQQLTNLRHPGQQQNAPSKPYPETQNVDVHVPNPIFESQRYQGEGDGPRNHQRQNNQHGNYDGVQNDPVDVAPQQSNYDQNQNSEPKRPYNGFSQPDPNTYPNGVSFPGQTHFQDNNQRQNYANELPQNFDTSNGDYQNNRQQPGVRSQAELVKTQSFSNVQRNRYIQSTGGQQQVFTQMSNQAGIFPAYPSQVQRGYRGESFRPLANGNYNNGQNQGQIKTNGGGQQVSNNGNFNQNLGQNAWRAQQPNLGNQNYNRVLIAPEQQNFYNINNQNANQQKINHNFGQDNGNQNSGGTSYNQPNQVPDNINQQVLIDGDTFSSTQVSSGQSTGTGLEINTQQYSISDSRNISTQGNPTDGVYFIPPLPAQDDVQTQIPAFDAPSTVGSTSDSDVGTTSISRGDITTLLQENDFETSSDGLSTSSGGRGRLDVQVDRSGSCDCSRSCAPMQRLPDENFGSSIREIARSLNADAFFEFVGLTDAEIESMLSTDGSYTLFIPSNEAVSRLPSNLIDHWRQNNPDFSMALLNHVIQDSISLSQLKQGGRLTSRANDATIFVNNYNNEAVTVNGHRIVHGDVTGPKGGLIHVIDGTLCPVADQDIINTLRTCNKYDGFLTLADVTKLLDTMQDEGPYTVFLPSNEALTKIPSEELAVLKENVTLLREFLEYHIVQGAYFSGDLKDGQYLTTLHQRQPIRVGIRVDGCYRRLVEANNSPLFKSDIPTKNGVIHVIDWILRPDDLNWCEGVILP